MREFLINREWYNYRNISYSTLLNQWVVQIRIEGKQHYFSVFRTEDEANRAYKWALNRIEA